jgi:PhnB protein
VIMFAQTPSDSSERPCGMFIYVENVADIYQKAMVENAASLMTPCQQEYGFTAGFQDVFGNQWWIVEG